MDRCLKKRLEETANALGLDIIDTMEIAIALFCRTYSADYLRERLESLREAMGRAAKFHKNDTVLKSYLVGLITEDISEKDISRDFEDRRRGEWTTPEMIEEELKAFMNKF